jgi:ADP-ribose pyrophosphatase
MKVNAVKKITDCKHLNLFSINYIDRKDYEKQWVFASRSEKSNPLEQDYAKPDAVVIVPYHTLTKKLVIIKEFRVALGDYQFGFPAGLIDKGESIEQAGQRELFEETGLNLTKVIKKSPAVFSSSGMTDESISLLYVECDGIATNNFNEDSEDIETIMLSESEAKVMVCNNNIKLDIKLWIVLNSFAFQGIL